ncbi:MAG: ferrochelatase [Planctomycetota bacterium]
MPLTHEEVTNYSACLPRCGSPEESAHCRHPLTATRQRRAVLLLHLGMPDAPDPRSVRRYLAEVLSDPEVTRLPRGLRWLNPALGRLLARVRSARMSEEYRRIWSLSGLRSNATSSAGSGLPLPTIAQEQASALESKLPGGMRVFSAMRHGRPGIAEALRQVEALGIESVVAVSMYPQQSGTTTLTAVRELYRQISLADCRLDVTVRSIWYDDAGYINAQSRLIHEFAETHGLTPENTHLVYSVRSLPVSCVDRGDPYMDQIHRTAALVSRRLGWPSDRTLIGYQGGGGSLKWLRPTTTEVLADLSRAGEKQVLVCPLSFTTDCLETLGEIHIRYRAQFENDGGRFFVCPALNVFEPFIAALRNLVIHDRHPVSFHGAEAGLLTRSPRSDAPQEDISAAIESLVMVGMSLGSRLGEGRGPSVAHADAEDLRSIKKSQCDAPEMLRAICGNGTVREGLLWNTCRRFEFYGWFDGAVDEAARAETVSNVRSRFFANNGRPDPSTVNVLRGADAWHYLMRTAAGLNSGLPGEREVLEQLLAAQRLAERAGTAGPMTSSLLAELTKQQTRLREQTDWGRYEAGYCYAALSQIVEKTGVVLSDCRCVVIGGSTTSCGILETLAERFGVSRRRLTLLHRGHGQGGHLKMLRKAIGNGRRIRVQKYSEKVVLEAIAGADVVFFGLDRKESLLDAEQIRGSRDFAVRPFTIIDFNTFGSTTGLEDLDGIRLWTAEDLEAAVAAYSDEMCGSGDFATAVEAAESWIREHIPSSSARVCAYA